MINKLAGLAAADHETELTEFALAWKQQGRKIVGYLDAYFPEEIILAAGMLPWKITGTMAPSTPLASVYRPQYTSLHCLHVLERFLRGELDFLDGVIMTDWDDDHIRLWDQLRLVKKIDFCPILHVPQIKTPTAIAFFTEALAKLKAELENFFRVEISDEDLQAAVAIGNETKGLLTRLQEARAQKPGLLRMGDLIRLITAGRARPREEFNADLERLLGELADSARSNRNDGRPRLAVSSDWLDEPAYLDLIEEAGAVVVMADLDNGSRYFHGQIAESGDPLRALAEYSLTKPPCPRMAFWEEQVDRLLGWVAEYQLDGLINFAEVYSWPRRFYAPYLTDRCRREGIPVTTILREYSLGRVGQIQTLAEAFIETMEY